ncbi:peptidoglycan binding domain-containing protein [Streptomyces sp. NPDC006326]|uniref:peptidoglycan binding domain-containing protein n=1 Tax=Streptomyces sp. NPDC006326 TaxID=3156752 RepID=UPI0033A39C57
MTSNPSTPDTDGPKTETTLTTRIRINIPGSRPIPPVVVRKPVAAAEPEAEPDTAPAAAEPAPAEPEEATNNWFAPRKPAAAAPAPGPAPSAGPAPALPTRTPSAPAAGPAPALPTRTPSAPAPLPTRTPAPPSGPAGPRPGAPAAGFAPGAPAGPGGPTGPGGPAGPGAPGAAGPRTGAPAGPGFDTPAGGFPPPAPLGGGYRPGGPAGSRPEPPYSDGGPSTEAFPAYGGGPAGPAGPAGPTGGPALGSVPVGAPHADAAPRWPGPGLDDPLPTPVPAPGPGAAGAERSAARPAPRPASAKPTKIKRGRSRLVVIGGGLIALVGVAYGAGLLLNHSDVPKGTTVLGVDISGSRDEAVAKLQTAFGNRAAAPLQLTVGGKQVELKPEKAGLSLDSQTTVRNAAGSDYNPVTVIGSLLGQERVAEPVMPVDEEKLQVALQELAGTAGTATEATIKFDTGKPVAVPGKAGTTLDADASADLVTKAFRTMVATGKADPVELPTTTKEPAVNQAELDRAMKEFAEPAMSGIATVKAGNKSLAFGAKSLPKILSMQAVDGHLVEKYDLEALKATYGNSFDGVLIMRGTGEKTPVTPQDVAGALGKALRGKTPAERTATIDTNAS